MKRRTRTTCLAFTFGTLALLARGQDLAPLSPPPTIEQAAGQQSNLPELTLEQALELALANNSSLKTASLDTLRAADDLAANKTRRFANTQVTALGAQLVTKPSVTYPAGSLGVYSATGPIPATNQTVEIPRKPVGIVNVLVAQPLSTQYQLHLKLKALALGVEGTRQDEVKTRLEVVDQVRRAYYAVVEAESALDSLRASLPYYRESHRLAFVNRGKETILESDLLNADAQLLKIQNAISDASDAVASATERLNDQMGRDIHTQFRVAAIGDADTDLATPEAMEARALQNRPDVKKAKLQVQQANYDARAKNAEYIPDVSLAFSYYTTANFENGDGNQERLQNRLGDGSIRAGRKGKVRQGQGTGRRQDQAGRYPRPAPGNGAHSVHQGLRGYVRIDAHSSESAGRSSAGRLDKQTS
jgi:outer membrane protein TolC